MTSPLIISKKDKASLEKTWIIYKSQWNTFLCIFGMFILIYIVYFIVNIILSLISLVPLAIDESGTLTALFSYGTQIPNWFFYYFLYNLLGALFMVVPALYFDRGQRITWEEPYKFLSKKCIRFSLAGIFFVMALTLGYFFCIIPGIIISFVTPVYVNKIACTEMPIIQGFTSSFQSVYKSENVFQYIALVVLAHIIVVIPNCCTFGLGSIITHPMMQIYIFHMAYNKGILT